MKIFYDKLEDFSTPLETAFSWEESGESFDIKNFSGELIKAEGFYLLRGHIHGSLTSKCDRCMGHALIALEGDIDVHIHPEKEQAATPAAEYEMSDAEGDVYVTDPEYMDLHDILRQEALLMVPSRKLCSESCSEEAVTVLEDESGTMEKNMPFKRLSLLKKDSKEK